ncbi:hypothetical protein RB195_020385 [Necator americanus]|uniref:Reverse transcriptase domain-containing protein n=1 Tax=Necator americanus TaxID=51031 RepID=A0ABR1CIK7_NECAM
MSRGGSAPALEIFVVYTPTSSYGEEEVEAFYMDLEKFYREDHTFYKFIIEVSREYNTPLCLTFIDLEKAFDTVETKAVKEALDNQSVLAPYIKLNLDKKTIIRNGWVPDAPFTFSGTNTSECSSYVCLGRKINMMNKLTELVRRKRADWGAFKSIEKT